MPVVGVPAFNAVAILKVDTILFNTNDVSLVAHGAFVNIDNGHTYGSTTCRHWSKATLDKLAELRQLMEEDMAALVFQRAAAHTSSAIEQADPGGIGEVVRGPSDAQQV